MLLLYWALWVIFNGQITLEIALFGVVIAAAVFAFTCRFMDYSVEKEKSLWRLAGEIFRYLVTLVVEILKANGAVMHMILTQKEEPRPMLVSFEADVKSALARTALADSITLTPGTITVSMEGNAYVVHCLDEDYAEGIDRSVFVDMLREIEAKDRK